MKKIILAYLISLTSFSAIAQSKINLGNFTKIEIPANFEIKLIQSESNQVSFEGKDNKNETIALLEKGVYISNNTLLFKLAEFGPNLPVELIVYTNHLQEIKLEANANVEMGSDSSIKAKEFKIIADGATKAELFIETEKLEAKINGASKLILDGKANEGTLEATGASRINAVGMAFENLNAEANGASKVSATIKTNLKVKVSGLAKMEYAGNPKNIEKEISGAAKIESVNEDNEDDRSVSAGVSINKGKKKKSRKNSTDMQSVFGGFEIGVSTFVTPNFNTTLSNASKNLETNMANSWRFAINFGDLDLPIVKGKLALATGLGLSFDYYGFKTKDSMISDDKIKLTYIQPNATLSSNYLTQFNITLPLLVKFNTNYNKNNSRFYFATGVIVNYTVSNKLITEYSKNGIDYETIAKGDFFVNRIRADATVRLGYGSICVFANYGLVPMFDNTIVADIRTMQVGLGLNF
jgi:hypothetical protein